MRPAPKLMMDQPGPASSRKAEDGATNYLEMYGLAKPPFGETRDGDDFILFDSHRQTFESLLDHMINRTGLVVLRGEEGAGKSKMLAAAAKLAADAGLRVITPEPATVGRIDIPRLINAIVRSAGNTDHTETNVKAAIAALLAPPRAVLLIDDITLLTADCVPVLVAIAQRTAGDTLIVVTTVTDLQANTSRAGLARLARVELQVPRLTPAEVKQYIERSFWVAGATTRRLLAAEAMRLIVANSNGLPGSINRVMEATFTAGYARGDAKITAKTVAATFAPPGPRRPRDLQPRALGAAHVTGIGLFLIGAGVFLYRGIAEDVATPQPSALAPAPSVAPVQPAIEPPVTMPATSAETLRPEVIDALMKRGQQSLSQGDVSAARLLFQRAAEAGNAQAATAAGKTFDPAFQPHGADPARAAEWYRIAVRNGDAAAAELLQRLEARPSIATQ